ncbi:YqjK-like family protein [Sulfurirhabdus autotrophica]|uniref:YqjK-like protein n=1 Tax=Sulfurirhabdus autotrophica TaxID=1706046 RepID=A0A4R3YFC2_9PROT|nr:YqjK-like family protein [Sulfurirhabdus autotrophica]TCV90612.1 YqjK-like protein [Sulfurirhabdus autotrophica]
MKHRLAEITNRRQALLEEIDAQRTEIAEISRYWQKPVEVAEFGFKAVRFVRSHPGWIAGSVAALMVWRRDGLIRFVKGCWRYYPAIIGYGMKLLPLINQTCCKTRKPGKDRST